MTARTLSSRGFAQHQPIPGAYGGTIRVYESSAASAPHLWVAIEGLDGQPAIHLTLDAARELVADLTDVIENHYHERGDR